MGVLGVAFPAQARRTALLQQRPPPLALAQALRCQRAPPPPSPPPPCQCSPWAWGGAGPLPPLAAVARKCWRWVEGCTSGQLGGLRWCWGWAQRSLRQSPCPALQVAAQWKWGLVGGKKEWRWEGQQGGARWGTGSAARCGCWGWWGRRREGGRLERGQGRQARCVEGQPTQESTRTEVVKAIVFGRILE